MSLTAATPPLKTVTETFSTKELILKTSVLPVVINGKTKHHTLTHSYYVTRLVEAVKVRSFSYPKIWETETTGKTLICANNMD